MKIFATSLEGFVPIDITKTLVAFMDFCYIARLDAITESSLNALDSALEQFHRYRKIFQASGVRPTGFSLPRQHSLVHYRHHIEKFGAPNGLSSSITESKHITAVKKPWRRSNRHEALGQMLVINTRNDKLAAARVDFSDRKMLHGTCLSEALWKLRNDHTGDDLEDDDDDDDDNDDDNGQDLSADGDDDLTGPVDDELPVSSKVSLARKPGKFFSSSQLQSFLTAMQLVHILWDRFGNLVNTSSRKTLKHLFGFSCFIKKTLVSLDPPLPFLLAQVSTSPRVYLCSTPPKPFFPPRVINLVSTDRTAKQSGPPAVGKQVGSQHPVGTAFSLPLGQTWRGQGVLTLQEFTYSSRLHLMTGYSNVPSSTNFASRSLNPTRTMASGCSNPTIAQMDSGSCPLFMLIPSSEPHIFYQSSRTTPPYQGRLISLTHSTCSGLSISTNT